MPTANWYFVAAGVICAFGPIIIHLLNRRRFRVVQWAAMDFLREAMQRNRRIMQLRDILLLCLRTLAVLLFGFSLARPGCTMRQETFDDTQPLHAIILVDNSLSMGYESLEGTLLAKAKDRARQLIDKLPTGSKISLIPTCGSREGYSVEPYDTKDDALEALDKLDLVDRSTSLRRAVTEAQRASSATELAKRIVLISDQQQLNWADAKSGEALQDLPAMQVVDVAPSEWENTWISDLRVQDGLADTETPTIIVATVQHRGPAPRRDLQVTLRMGDTVLGEKTVTVESAQGGKEVDFEVVFNTLSELPQPDKPIFVPLRASLSPDRLAADDERFLAAPVVAALPVVFVDQYGEEGEDPIKGQVGETRPLRKLLAPKTARSDAPRQLVKVRHITLDDLTQDVLADARLVVIAGLQTPGEAVPLLREYVRQGGQLVIAAGANFDPDAWNTAAWNGGDGILPLPLAREPIGEVPEVAGANLKVFHLAFDSLSGEDYFQLANIAETELRDLYAEPFFFKAVQVDDSPETKQACRDNEIKRLDEELSFIAAARQRREELSAKESQGDLTEAERQILREDDAKLRQLRPQWLLWAASGDFGVALDEALPAGPSEQRTRRLDTLARQSDPKVLAAFESEGRPPYLVSRRMGRGEVIFAASGLASSWNTLATTNSVVMFDRILRSLTQSTLPKRNFAAVEKLAIPLPSEDPNLAVVLARPGQKSAQEPLDVGYIGTDQRGVTVTSLLVRGVYRVVGLREGAATDPDVAADKTLWEVPLVVGGDGDESDLAPLPRDDFDALAANANLRWVGPAEDISLAGVAIYGQNSWWWLALVVLVLLLVEMTTLAWPTFRPDAVPIPVAGS